MSELTLQEAALAWAQGKRVEASHANSCRWLPIDTAGQRSKRGYSTLVFSDTDYHFRLAPEPPAKKFRPWTPEEVPVGAVIKAKERGWMSVIMGVSSSGYIEIHGGGFASEFALENHVHSIDPAGTPANKRTWLPCGVEVSE